MNKWVARIILALLVVGFITFLVLSGTWLDFLILIGIVGGALGFIAGLYYLITRAIDIK